MSSKMTKVLWLAVAIVGTFTASAFADASTDAARASARAFDDRHYVEVAYTSAQFQEASELRDALDKDEVVFVPSDERTYVEVAYDAEDFAEAREITAMEEHGNPFAEVQHVAAAK